MVGQKMEITRKRQRSAEHDNEHENNNIGQPQQSLRKQHRQNTKSSSSSQIRKAATTIVATMLASSFSPTMAAAEENLLHPGVQPLYHPATAATTSDKATNNIIQASADISCQDDPDFVSTLGLSCSDHELHGCKQAAIQELGYDLHGMVELLNHCPVTCQIPPCENHSHNPIREVGHDQAHDGRITISAERSLLNSDDGSNEGEFEAIFEGQSVSSSVVISRLRGGKHPNQQPASPHTNVRDVVDTCFEGLHPFCHDDPFYVSKTGLPCEFHSSFDCSAWTNVGYTEMEVYDLINSCPCSCAVPCG